MAKKVIEEYFDDINGEPGATTHHFAYQGVHYEIDLGPDNTADLEADMARWIQHARTSPDAAKSAKEAERTRLRAHARADQDGQAFRAEVKDWWAGNVAYVREQTGREFPHRGRVAADVIALYRESTSGRAAPAVQMRE